VSGAGGGYGFWNYWIRVETDIAAAMGTYPREVRRVGWRYLEQGLAAALSDDPRPRPPKLLDASQQAAIVAMVWGLPPPSPWENGHVE
jgi:hypothetical protein